MKPRFYLSSKKNKDGRAAVLLFLSYCGTRIAISTGKIIKSENWNPVKQCAKGINAASLDFNNELLSFANNAIAILKDLVDRKETEVLVKLKKLLKNNISEQKNNMRNLLHGEGGTFLSFIDEYAKEAPKSKGTRDQYLATLNLLKEFQIKIYKKQIDFESIDLKFYNLFLIFCQEEKNYATNNIGKYIKNIKFLLGYSEGEGLHTNLIFNSKRFRKPIEESFSISLSEKELGMLYEHDFSADEIKENVRDLFIVNSWIGVRVGDLFTISKEHIRNNSIIIRTEKTNEIVEIPLHPTAKTILEKNNGRLPNNFPIYVYSNLLKTICSEAGLCDEIAYSKTKGGQKTMIVKPKYKMITPHTARRNFATNLYVRGLPVQTIMAITGHQSELSFRKYIKSQRIDAVKNLQSFFSNVNAVN